MGLILTPPTPTNRARGVAPSGSTFADIAADALSGREYSLIVCSFALHLCEPSRLPALAFELARAADAMLILTPHKKPEIRACLRDGRWRASASSNVRAVEMVRETSNVTT